MHKIHEIFLKIKAYISSKAKPIRDIAIFIGFAFALILIFTLIINASIISTTQDRIYSADEIKSLTGEYDCVLVLGAGVRANGTPTPMLADRLSVGCSTFSECGASVLLLSGDSENDDYMETPVMESYCIEQGIAAEDILCDGWGLSTYESIWRAKYVYGFDKVLIISQKYHLYRALHIADSLGIEAYGVDAALQSYIRQVRYDIRESLARIKDMICSELKPVPKYSERWEDYRHNG